MGLTELSKGFNTPLTIRVKDRIWQHSKYEHKTGKNSQKYIDRKLMIIDMT